MSNKTAKRLRAFVRHMGFNPETNKGLMRRVKREYLRSKARSITL